MSSFKLVLDVGLSVVTGGAGRVLTGGLGKDPYLKQFSSLPAKSAM